MMRIKPASQLAGPVVQAIRAAADACEAAGFGGDDTRGHAFYLRHIAAHLEAGAAKESYPQIYDYDPGQKVAAARLAAEACKTTADEDAMHSLLGQLQLSAAADRGEKFTLAQIDERLDAMNIRGHAASAAKYRLTQAGLISDAMRPATMRVR